jgi:hypothetical protein
MTNQLLLSLEAEGAEMTADKAKNIVEGGDAA